MLANSYKVGCSLWGAVVLLLGHLKPLCQVLRQAWPRCNDITLSAAQKEMHHPLFLDGPSAAKKQSRQKLHAFLYKGAQGELLLPLFSKNKLESVTRSLSRIKFLTSRNRQVGCVVLLPALQVLAQQSAGWVCGSTVVPYTRLLATPL